jgi:hypothetical protein
MPPNDRLPAASEASRMPAPGRTETSATDRIAPFACGRPVAGMQHRRHSRSRFITDAGCDAERRAVVCVTGVGRAIHRVLLAKRRVVDGVADICGMKIANLALGNVAHESSLCAGGVPSDHPGARCHKF